LLGQYIFSESPIENYEDLGLQLVSSDFPICNFRNWIINGNMEVAQRGTTWTNPVHTLYTIDRFIQMVVPDSGTPPTIIHSQQSFTPGDLSGSGKFYRINVDGAGSSFGNASLHGMYQCIENGLNYLCGLDKKVTVSFYAKSDITNKKIGIWLAQNYGSGGSPTSQETITGNKWTLTSTWTKYTYTFTTNTLSGKTFGTDGFDRLILAFFTQWGSNFASYVGDTIAESFVGAGNIDIAQVALYAGDVSYPFEPVPFDIELQRCMRYYEKSYAYGVYAGAANLSGCCMGRAIDVNYCDVDRTTFKAIKRISPTLNIYNGATGTLNSVSDFSTGSNVALSRYGYQNDRQACGYLYSAGGFTAGHTYLFHYTADADF